MFRRRSAFSLVEILVVIAIIAVLVTLLLPVLGRTREQSRRSVCISNQRQLGMAALMTVQDNKEQFPGTLDSPDAELWRREIKPYVQTQKVWRCPSNLDAEDDDGSDYGFNAYLFGVAMGEITRSSEVVLLADANSLLLQSATAVATRRHAGNYIATFVDGHQQVLNAAKDKVIYAEGEEGTLLSFAPHHLPITFASDTAAQGEDTSTTEGVAVLLTNKTTTPITVPVTAQGGETAPGAGLNPNAGEITIRPGQSRAYRLMCRTLGASNQKVETRYIFGTPPDDVTVTVRERIKADELAPAM